MSGRLAGVWFEIQDTCFRANLQISWHALFHDMTLQFFRKLDTPYVLVIKPATRKLIHGGSSRTTKFLTHTDACNYQVAKHLKRSANLLGT